MAKILLVEDDKSLREIYGVRLMAEGYEIVSAGDGEEALAMAIKERPDLIVSDVMMPKISGFDMLDILRSTTETKDVKVIMMTALSSDDQRARGESLGADRYLVKSQVGIEDVVRTVHDVLGDSIASAPATPIFPSAASMAPSTPAPAPQPVAAAPVAAPIVEPAPTPAPAPVQAAAPAAPAAPVFEPVPAPQPVQPIATPQPVVAAPAPVAQPAPAPAPVVEPVVVPAAPVPAPAAAPTPVFPPQQPVNPLPQPTAPFSSPAPASLGERVIQPLTNPVTQEATTASIAAQMEQALNGPNQPGGTPPVPPAA